MATISAISGTKSNSLVPAKVLAGAGTLAEPEGAAADADSAAWSRAGAQAPRESAKSALSPSHGRIG